MNHHTKWTRRRFLGTATIGSVTLSAGMGGFSIAARAQGANAFLSNGKIAFGTILPLSGGFTVVSQPWIHAIKYAIEEINAAGGVKIGNTSYEVSNPIGDEQYSAQGGLTAFRRLAADNTHYTGGYVSVEAPAAVQGVNEQENHLMTIGLTGKDLCLTNNKLRFYEYALAQATGPYLAHYAYHVLNVRKVGSIDLANTWGEDFYFSFKNTFEALGGKMSSRGFLQPNQTDFSAQITEMAADRIDALYIIMGDGPASAVALQARQSGLAGIPLLGQGAWGPEMYFDDMGKRIMDGAVYPGVIAYSQWSDKHQVLNNKLYADTKLYLNNWFWHGYDPTKTVLWAMQEAGSLDPRDVIEAIPAVIDKRKGELLVAPVGAIRTKEKGVYLKIPMTIGRFNANADFANGPTLIAAKEPLYNGFPGWMGETWEGYTADPADPSVNWYPTFDELKKF